MSTIMLSVPEMQVLPVLEAIKHLVPRGKITLLKEEDLPAHAAVTQHNFDELAQKIAMAIRPKPNQPMRTEVLKLVLSGGTTSTDPMDLLMQTPDHSLRNGIGAVSKALASIFPSDIAPIDRLAKREKMSGVSGYIGTSYKPTPLGLKVFELLKLKEWL